MKRSKKKQQQRGGGAAGGGGTNALLVTGFIDVELWNRAGWLGVGYLGFGDDSPPALALLFKDEASAKRIFDGWHKRIGPEDRFEELRIAIIEGDIAGQDPGYSVHINANIEGVKKHFELIGQPFDGDKFMVISRIHRMNPDPGSPHLGRFKAEFARHKVFRLVPMVIRAGTPTPLLDLGMTKREVHFRRVEEIGEHDLDRVVLGDIAKPN